MKNLGIYKPHQVQRLAFVHHKGGTGKTTSCLNIGGWLSKMNQKVLVLDLDPQGNATAGLGVDAKSIKTSISNVLLDQKKIEDTVLETNSGIFLIPATLDLLAAEIQLARQSNSAGLLRSKIAGLGKYFDFILFDAPPGSSLLMINSIVAAENIIIPVDSGVFGFETLETLKALLLDIDDELGVEVNVMMVLLKSFSSSLFDGGITQKVKKWAEEYFLANGLKTCKICTIPFSKKICRAQMLGIPISHYAPFSKVGRTYRRIAEDILIGD